ncbi:MAG: hypothetical protein WKF94_03920 [Solirubrobacteraceae bacterium]
MSTLVVAAAVLVGCGGSDNLAPLEQVGMVDHVDRARQAAQAGDIVGAERALDDLRKAVVRLRATGELGDGSAQRLDAAIASTSRAVTTELRGEPEPDEPQQTPVPEVQTPTPAADDEAATQEPPSAPGPPDDPDKDAERAIAEAEREAEKEAREAEKDKKGD